MKVHHVGYLVKNLQKSIPAFEILGYQVTKESIWDEGRKADICFLENSDGYCIELIAPSAESAMYPLLKQYKNSPYHLCYCCENLNQAIEDLKRENYVLFLEPAPAPAIGGSRVAFLMSARAGMIELVEL